MFEEKRKLSEPSVGKQPEQLSRGLSNIRASFADFGRVNAPLSLCQSEQGKPPATPSTSSQSQGHEGPFLHPQRHQTSSPSSSISSFHKAASSTNLAIESSPASSRSVQGFSEKSQTARLSKGKLNLLNPVSLLKRRRTSQVVENVDDTPVIPTKSMDVPAMRLPANYDPRIKGKGIHNFDDGPQPKRNWSTNDMPGMAQQVSQSIGEAARRSSIPVIGEKLREDDRTHSYEREHAPVFVENFEEEGKEPAEGASAVQRETLANSNFLARMSKQLNFDDFDFTPPMPTTKLSDTNPPPPASSQHASTQPTHNARNSRNTDISSARISSDQSTARSSESNDTKATSPPQSPRVNSATKQSRTLEAPFQPSHQLSHLPSTASHNSRFSFQLNSDHCIEQEKALEDKHKQKQAARHTKNVSVADSRFDDFDEDSLDYDDMMDDMGYEEEIPTMNADEEITSTGLGDKCLSSFSNSLTQDADKSKFSDTTRTSSQSHYTASSQERVSQETNIVTAYSLQQTQAPVGPEPHPTEGGYTEPTSFGDMYFSDGLIDESIIDAVSGADGTFDESLLDSPVQTTEHQPVDDFPTPTRAHGKQRQSLDDEEEYSSEIVKTTIYQDDPFGISDERTPTKPAPDWSVLQPNASAPSNNLNAYHNALVEATSQAVRDGKFTRQNSVLTASSIYSSHSSAADQSAGDLLGDENDILGARQPLEDNEGEDDLMVAAANAQALASEDDSFYAQEFGFYRNPNTTGDGELHNGGYFGEANFLGASLRNREPNLTPITERSEYSTRNSVVGSTPWGPPSTGPWGPPSSASQTNLTNPGLKDLAARVGMDDEDMTLGQLLRLRKETFGAGSGPHSAHPSSSSNDSSPISQHNPSPLAGRSMPGSVMSGSFASIDHRRRSSELELPQVDEVPESVESGEDSQVQESPTSDNITLGTARAILYNNRNHQRRGSAEILAQEYSSLINDSPVPIIAEPIKPTPPSSPEQSDFSFGSPATVAGPSSPPILATPKPQRASVGLPMRMVAPKTSSPLSSPPIGSQQTGQSSNVPSPPTALLQKFANRPAADTYRRSADLSVIQHHRRRSSVESEGEGHSSVAYVCDVDDDGVEKWFLEKRRMKGSGELIVIGREPVENLGM